MTLFDLLFILLFLIALGMLVAALFAALRGRRDRALALLRRLGLGIVAYMVVVLGVSLATPRRTLAIGDDQCSDDWCIAVSDIAATEAPARVVYTVTFRVFSRARRVSQRERFVVAYMRDGDGHRYNAEPSDEQPPFDVRLGPEESVITTRVFRVPVGAAGLGVVVAREGGIPFPTCCIVGEGLFHKDPLVLVQ